jgi:CheY-like chemotaxis protein
MSGSRLILVVDDDPDIRDTLSEVLSEQGFEVRTAPNGREALRALRHGLSPALILLDVMMPVMDGWQFRAEQLRAPELASIPVVLLSAHSNVRDMADRTKASGVLKKPLRLKDLLAMLKRALEAPAPGLEE